MVVLRWIVMFPAAVLGAILAYWLLKTGNRLSCAMVGFDPDGVLVGSGIEILSSIIMGVAFVYIPAKIAPLHKRLVVFIFAALGILFAGMGILPAILGKNWVAILASVALAIGAGGVAYALYTGEIDEDDLML